MDKYYNGMFNRSKATKIKVLNKFNTSNVTGAPRMFENATNLVGGTGTTYNIYP